MADYSLKINGTEFTEVQGTEDWSKTIVRDFNDRVFRTKGDFNLTAWGSLFDLIYGNVSNNGACTSLNSRIYFRENKIQDYSEWWRGEMKMQDGQWDLIKQKVDIQILDDVWASKFANSDDQKVTLTSTVSKNDGYIPACPSSECQLYDPTDSSLGAFLADKRLFYRVFDVFTFLVDYHTNGVATFSSTFFDTGGDGEQYYITTGKEIRDAKLIANPEVSFSELFDEMKKKFNLWIIIDSDSFDNPIVKVEQQSYVFENTKAVEVEDPENIVMQIDLDQLYTIIEVGSNSPKFKEIDGADYPTPKFYAWNDESYNTPGDCEFENNTLNLVSSWKIDTNSIQHQIDAGASEGDYEDDIFIVEIDPSTLNAYKFTTEYTLDSDYTSVVGSYAYFIYNYNLTNTEVINNWFDGIPEDIISDVGERVDAYVDTVTTTNITTIFRDLDFSNDTVLPAHDNYDLWYTAAEDPSNPNQFRPNSTGVWTLYVEIDIRIPSPTAGDEIIIYAIASNAPGGTGIWSKPIDTITLPAAPSAPYDVTLSGTINVPMNLGEIVKPRIERNLSSGNLTITGGYATFIGGVNSFNKTATDEPLIYDYDVSRFKLALSDYNTLDNNLGYIRFIDTKNNQKYDVWATEMKYNPVTQIVESGKFIGKPVVLNCEWVLTGGIWTDVNCWDDGQLWID